MGLVKKNGRAFDSGDVTVALFGRIDFEVTEITYNTAQEHQPNHSLGSNKLTSFSMGKVSNTGSITLRLASASAIEKAAGGDLLKVKPFHVNVSFVNDDNDIINDTLLVKFQSQGREVGGDMDLKKQFELFILDVDYNNA
jgi:hypothetical protein